MSYAQEDCEVYCNICKQVIKLNKGEESPTYNINTSSTSMEL